MAQPDSFLVVHVDHDFNVGYLSYTGKMTLNRLVDLELVEQGDERYQAVSKFTKTGDLGHWFGYHDFVVVRVDDEEAAQLAED